MTIQVGSLVRIAHPPQKYNRDMAEVGLVGVVTELTEVEWEESPVPFFQGIGLDGRPSGAGNIEIECLEETRDPRWVQARIRYDEILEKQRLDTEAWSERCRKENARKERVASAALAASAETLGVTEDAVQKTLKAYNDSLCDADAKDPEPIHPRGCYCCG